MSLIDSAVARRIAHDLRGATGIVAGALREIEAGSDVAPFITMARRSTARLERVARTLDALGHEENAVEARPDVVDVDAVLAEAIARIATELRPGFAISQKKGSPTATLGKAAFSAGVDEVLACYGKRAKSIEIDGAVIIGVGYDHVPASAKPFEDPLGAARLLLERSGATLVLELEGNALKARLVPG